MRRRYGRRIFFWLLVCFPYGLFLMWRRRCRWHPVIKGFVTAAAMCAVAAIIMAPAPSRTMGTKITLVGDKPGAEIFGPEAPEGYNPSAYIPRDEQTDLFAGTVEEESVYVYASATEGSTYYHSYTCEYAYASSRRMTLYEAYMLGYTTPCGKCNPPVYDGSGVN